MESLLCEGVNGKGEVPSLLFIRSPWRQVYAAQYSKCDVEGRRLIAAGGSGANELRLFDGVTHDAIGRLLLPRGVYGLDFSHSGKFLAVAGGDCVVRLLAVPPYAGEKGLEAKAAVGAAAGRSPSKAQAPLGNTDEEVELDAGAPEEAEEAVDLNTGALSVD